MAARTEQSRSANAECGLFAAREPLQAPLAAAGRSWQSVSEGGALANQFAVGAAVVKVLPTTVQERLPQTAHRACLRAQAGGQAGREGGQVCAERTLISGSVHSLKSVICTCSHRGSQCGARWSPRAGSTCSAELQTLTRAGPVVGHS